MVLFDEIEKAHQEIYNSLLQVLEDGRLTDGQGRTVDFKNTVLIFTSNLGTSDISKAVGLGFTQGGGENNYERMKQKVNDELKKHFRPEFLNRIDDIIVFHQLTQDEIIKMVDLMIGRVGKQLKAKDMTMELTDKAKSLLAKRGFDPVLGARPLRRTIQREIEDALSEKILFDEVGPGQLVTVDVENWDGEGAGEDAMFTFVGDRSRPRRRKPDLAQAGAAGAPTASRVDDTKAGGTPTGCRPFSCVVGRGVTVGSATCSTCCCNRRTKESGGIPERSRHCESQTRRPSHSVLRDANSRKDIDMTSPEAPKSAAHARIDFSATKAARVAVAHRLPRSAGALLRRHGPGRDVGLRRQHPTSTSSCTTPATSSASPATDDRRTGQLNMEKQIIGRGLLAGALAGVLAFVFARIFVEPVIGRAIDYEDGVGAAHEAMEAPRAGHSHDDEGGELFTRGIQTNIGMGFGVLAVQRGDGRAVRGGLRRSLRPGRQPLGARSCRFCVAGGMLSRLWSFRR